MEANNQEKILIVGGAGYIGGAITDILLKDNRDFLVYDNLTFERDYRKPVNFVFGDIKDKKHLKNVIERYRPTSIIWLAAMVGDGACQVNPEMTIELNQESVKWLSENYDGRIVFASTCSVYGKGEGILTEESPKNPLSMYAITKLKAESYLKEKNAVIFRLGTLFGISDSYSRIRLDLVVNILSLKAVMGEPLTVFGGEQWRPLLHVRDAAKAMVGAALLSREDNIPAGTYNIAYKNMTIKEVGEEVRDAFEGGEKPKITYSDISFEDARNYRASAHKYNSLKGAEKFTISVTEGSREIMNLVKEGRIKNPLDANYHNAKYIKDRYGLEN